MKPYVIGFWCVFAMMLVVLKLANAGDVAGWPWWAVLSPLWLPATSIGIVTAVFWLGAVVVDVWERR